MDPTLWPADSSGRMPGVRAVTDPTKPPRLPRIGAGLERLGDGALALLFSLLSVRLAAAVEIREARGWDSQASVGGALGFSIAFGLAVVVIGTWALVVAPLLSVVSMRSLRRRWHAKRRVPFGRIALVSLGSVALPLAYVAAIEIFATSAPQGVRDLAWVLVALAALNPILVFAASVTIARDRVVRVVILLLALASLIHLSFTLYGA